MLLSSRKMAKVMHPDKGGSEEKMAAVNEAYEVLSNPGGFILPFLIAYMTSFGFGLILSITSSLHTYTAVYSSNFFTNDHLAELRQRFDNGDDPNDPTSQSGGHPFQQGGHPFMQFFQQSSSNGGFSFGQGGGPFSFQFRSGAGQRGGPF